ncbi:MAG: ferredoxin [Bacteroidetes bacterium]|nr:MAG: ferredoxin [Bacteroidota bacterium]
MALISEKENTVQQLEDIGRKMMIAARTAPKGKGKNTLEIILITDSEIDELAATLHKMGDETNTDFYHRDANNLEDSAAVLLIGTEIKTLGLNEICQLCGFENCAEKEKYPNTPCVFNTSDLNIAIGSAVSIAANHRVDNRIMFSLGKAALKRKIFKKDIKIAFGIPISATSKNPFFDR